MFGKDNSFICNLVRTLSKLPSIEKRGQFFIVFISELHQYISLEAKYIEFIFEIKEVILINYLK